MQQSHAPTLTPESTELFDARPRPGEPRIASFNLRRHLAATASAGDPVKHLRYGLETWLATKMMQAAIASNPALPKAYEPRWGQYKQIEREMHSVTSKRRQLVVFTKMPFLGGLKDDVGIDFERELRDYRVLDYHKHYLQPFHSLPGGWLNPRAATANEAAMRALFAPSTKRGCEGLREEVAKQVPREAKVVYDFGASTGMQGRFFAERLGPDARVVCIDPSPFGIIYGKRTIRDPRIEWVHDFAEDAPLPDASGDVVNMFFLLHETPDHIKQKLIDTAFRVLKPGGQLQIAEPPLWDLEYRSRGFFEPFRAQWLHWDGRRMLERAGFTHITQEDIADPQYVHCFQAKKPYVTAS